MLIEPAAARRQAITARAAFTGNEAESKRITWLSPRPVLFITGDQAHSRLFSEHAYSRASEPKELFIVPGAGHVDLYDRVNLIPWDKLQSFFAKHLPGTKARSSR